MRPARRSPTSWTQQPRGEVPFCDKYFEESKALSRTLIWSSVHLWLLGGLVKLNSGLQSTLHELFAKEQVPEVGRVRRNSWVRQTIWLVEQQRGPAPPGRRKI